MVKKNNSKKDLKKKESKKLSVEVHTVHEKNKLSRKIKRGVVLVESDSEYEPEQQFSNLKIDKCSKKVKISKKLTKTKVSKENITTSDELTTDEVDETDRKILAELLKKKDLGPLRIRAGLCCINNYLRTKKPTIFCSRGITLSTYKDKGAELAQEKALQNIQDISKIISWNKSHYIDCLRLSSDIFPHYSNLTHIEENKRYNMSFAVKALKEAGDYAKQMNQRITMHPGQFNVVGTPHEKVFENTCYDLKMHADILDNMGMDEHSILVVHGGGTYGDKEQTIQRWIKNFKKLPQNVQKRLVLENCEKNFSIEDCLKVSEELNIPVVLDNHHFDCYKKFHPEEEFKDIRHYIPKVLISWVRRGIRPKFHISEQRPDKPVGTHSDYIKVFPEYYSEIPEKYGVGVDVMIEAKAKEAAIMDLYSRYSDVFLGHLAEVDQELLEFDYDKLKALAD